MKHLVAILLLFLANTMSYASCLYFDNFAENGDGTVTDARNGTIWQKCAVGQKWSENSCIGIAEKLSWAQAMSKAKSDRFLGKSDWRVPGLDELLAVVIDYESCNDDDINDPKKRGASTVLAYPTNTEGKLLGIFWSSSLYDAKVYPRSLSDLID